MASISLSLFLVGCLKTRLNQGSFVLLFFALFAACFEPYSVCVFSCSVLFVSISQVIGCEDRLQRDPDCIVCGIKFYSNRQPIFMPFNLTFFV